VKPAAGDGGGGCGGLAGGLAGGIGGAADGGELFHHQHYGYGVILFSAMNNWMELTRGPMEIPGVSAMPLFGHPLTEKWEWVLLVGFFYTLVFWVAHNFKRSALGRIILHQV
jgi:ABC-type branched-subunit amino acid transport system permease subunit